MATIKKVLANVQQSLTDNEKKQARDNIDALGKNDSASILTGNTIGSTWTKVSPDYSKWTKVKNSSSDATLRIYAKPTIVSFILNIDAQKFTDTSRSISIKLATKDDDSIVFSARGNIMILPGQLYQIPIIFMNNAPTEGSYCLYVSGGWQESDGIVKVQDFTWVDAMTV